MPVRDASIWKKKAFSFGPPGPCSCGLLVSTGPYSFDADFAEDSFSPDVRALNGFDHAIGAVPRMR